jgi:predicted GNAT family acetyltransferase
MAELEVDMVHDEDASRYEGRVAGELVGVVDYRLQGSTVVVTHTGTEPRWRGQGIAGRLTRFVLDDIRAQGRRVQPGCPYTADYLDRHPDDQDLLA